MADRSGRDVVRWAWAVFAIAPGLLLACAVEAGDDPKQAVVQRDVHQLVQRLGSDQYVLRRRAERELIRFGFDAFDALKAAEGDEDLEVAARAAYLTQLIEIDWTTDDDPHEVQHLMEGYGELSEEERRKKIDALASLPENGGLTALCRVVRCDASPMISKTAATSVLEAAGAPKVGFSDRIQLIRKNLGSSARPGAKWILVELLSLTEPESALNQWRELINKERQMGQGPRDPSHAVFVLALMRRQVKLLKQLQRREEAAAEMMKMVDLEPGESGTLVELVDWLVQEEAWSVIDEVAERYADRFNSHATLLYSLAQARAVQGRKGLAEEVAEQAFALEPESPEKHGKAAIELEKRGTYRWAEREYRHVIDLGPPPQASSRWGSERLALMLHDIGKEYEAGKVLRIYLDQADKVIAQRQRRLAKEGHKEHQKQSPNRKNQRQSGTAADPLRNLRARMEYYYATDAAKRQDWTKNREHLDRAIQHDPTDADVLIAMYHLQDADSAYRERTRQLIEKAAATFRRQIKQDVDEPTYYNQLAWLVGNTVGDFDEALRASQKSLELMPGLPAYLDTLAHCHYAKGDYANAVRFQSQAASLQPHTQVIVRKLRFFRSAFHDSKDR